jgi:prophage regulatory protein
MSVTLLSYVALRAKGVPFSKSQLWRLERDGKFPKRVRLSEARVAWVESEIDTWVELRLKARDLAA